MPAFLPVIDQRPDDDGDACQRQRDEQPAQGVEIGDERQGSTLSLDQNLLRDLDPGGADCGTPAVPVPRNVRLSASTSRAGGASRAKGTARTGNRSPHCRAEPRSMWMKPERG